MLYEISDEDVRVFQRACWVAYTVLSQEAEGGLVTAPMASIRDACNRLEAQKPAGVEETSLPVVAASVLEGESTRLPDDPTQIA